MNDLENKFDKKNILPVELKLLNGQVDIILRSLELYAYNLEYMLDNEKSNDNERQQKVAMLKYTYEEVLATQAAQVNEKANNIETLNTFGKNIIKESNLINIIPNKKDIKAI